MTSSMKYECEICKKLYATRYTLQVHQKLHQETRVREFPCSLYGCDKSFYTDQLRVQHEKRHNAKREHQCNACGNVFKTFAYLKNHYQIVHSGERPFKCETCGKSFARKAEFENHMRIHTGERPFQCEDCHKTFTQRSNLQTHIRTTHKGEKRHKCPECDMRFKRQRLVTYHIYAKHRDEKPLQCVFCDKKFVYPQLFKKHMLSCKFTPKNNYFIWQASEDKSYLLNRVGMQYYPVNPDDFLDPADTNLEQQNSTDNEIYEVTLKNEDGCWYTFDCVKEYVSDLEGKFDLHITDSLVRNSIPVQELCQTEPTRDIGNIDNLTINMCDLFTDDGANLAFQSPIFPEK